MSPATMTAAAPSLLMRFATDPQSEPLAVSPTKATFKLAVVATVPAAAVSALSLLARSPPPPAACIACCAPDDSTGSAPDAQPPSTTNHAQNTRAPSSLQDVRDMCLLLAKRE